MICNMEVWAGLNNRLVFQDGISVTAAMKQINDYRKKALLAGAKKEVQHILYAVIQYDSILDIITTVSLFKETFLTDEELDALTAKFEDAEFYVLHLSNSKGLCRKFAEEEKSKRILPITLKEANSFIAEHHRHHDSCTGCKFSIGLFKTKNGIETMIGCAICGRPVSRYLDNGLTLEINRLCTTDNCENGCSMLYSRCVRIAREMGYEKVITYILESENGASLKASNFVLENECCGGREWTGKRRKDTKTPKEMKQRWVKIL